MTKPLITAVDLKTWFIIRRGVMGKPIVVRAVDGVSLTIDEGESVAVVGESGSGKTTLGKTLLRLYRPNMGAITYDGRRIENLDEKELKWYRRETQIIYQDPFSSLNPFFSVERCISEPLLIHKIARDRADIQERVLQSLEDVKLTPPEMFASKFPHMLSGGQRQRVAIARALILNPRFVVADEPVSMLDASVRVEIMLLLRDLQRKHGTSFMYVTHDLATVKYFSERLFIMYAGKIVESGKTHELLNNPLHPYTQALLSAIPDPDPSNRLRMRQVPGGEPPSPIDPPPGCRFHPRCPYFIPGRCDVIEPSLVSITGDHQVACHLYERT